MARKEGIAPLVTFAGVFATVVAAGAWMMFGGSPTPPPADASKPVAAATGSALQALANVRGAPEKDAAKTQPWSVAPRAAGESGASATGADGAAAAGYDTAATPGAGGGKVLPKFGPRDVPEEARETRARVMQRRREAATALVTAARNIARDERHCAKGDARACARLHEKGADRSKDLVEMKDKLAGACDKNDLNACVFRGDVELVGKSAESSKEWYAKARTLAADVKAKCSAGQEKNARACQRVERTLTLIEAREKKTAAATAPTK